MSDQICHRKLCQLPWSRQRGRYRLDLVQGTDYAYTLQGWLKGINGDRLDQRTDMGRDGDPSLSPNANLNVGRDAFAMSLGYYGDSDYKGISAAWDDDQPASIAQRPFAHHADRLFARVRPGLPVKMKGLLAVQFGDYFVAVVVNVRRFRDLCFDGAANALQGGLVPNQHEALHERELDACDVHWRFLLTQG